MSQTEELLDIPFNEQPGIDFTESIRWWETRRILFNIILVLCEVTSIEAMPNGVLRWGFSRVVLGSIVFTLCANACYTLGFGTTIARLHYLKKTGVYPNLRLLTYLIGVIFSIFVTFVVFGKVLDVEEI